VRAALQSATAVTANFGKDWSKNAAPKHAALFKQFFGKTDPMEDNYTANQVLRLMDEAFHGKLTFV
jgi:hypothetical protein